MERLTKKISKTVQDKYSLGSYLQYDFARADDTNKLLNKLGKFEDLMEKYNVESMEDLELRLEDVEHYAYNCNVEQIDEIIKLKQEAQALKDRWQKLKDFVVDKLKYDREFVELTENDMYYDFSIVDQTFLNKMQELEEEE